MRDWSMSPETLAFAYVQLQSPITNHQSRITNHQSPITNHQSPITNHQYRNLLKRARHLEYMLPDIREDQVRRDRRDLVEPGFAEFPFDIVFGREAIAAVG